MTTGTPLALAGGVFMLSGERLAREECRLQMQRFGIRLKPQVPETRLPAPRRNAQSNMRPSTGRAHRVCVQSKGSLLPFRIFCTPQ